MAIAVSVAAKSQEIKSIGFTGAWLNHRQSVAGGLALTIQKDLFNTDHSSLSLGTTVKAGVEDKMGRGAAYSKPTSFAGVAAAWTSPAANLNCFEQIHPPNPPE